MGLVEQELLTLPEHLYTGDQHDLVIDDFCVV